MMMMMMTLIKITNMIIQKNQHRQIIQMIILKCFALNIQSNM